MVMPDNIYIYIQYMYLPCMYIYIYKLMWINIDMIHHDSYSLIHETHAKFLYRVDYVLSGCCRVTDLTWNYTHGIVGFESFPPIHSFQLPWLPELLWSRAEASFLSTFPSNISWATRCGKPCGNRRTAWCQRPESFGRSDHLSASTPGQFLDATGHDTVPFANTEYPQHSPPFPTYIDIAGLIKFHSIQYLFNLVTVTFHGATFQQALKLPQEMAGRDLEESQHFCSMHFGGRMFGHVGSVFKPSVTLLHCW